ncbi:MAG: amino acid permease [Gammaproteobacteria bacterium]
MTPESRHGEQRPSGLKRALSLPLVTFYGLGNILGAGIYVLTGKVVAHAGLFAPLSFLIASLLAGLTALAYAELAARYPLSAGEAVYVQEGIGVGAISALVGLLIILAGIVSAATILRGFVGYLQVFVPVADVVVIPLLVLVLGGLAAWGIVESVMVAALLTVVEIFGLLLIIRVAAPAMVTMEPTLSDFYPLLDGGVWQGIFIGGFLAFYAFIGFEDMVNVAEEVRQPQRNMPRAILLALLVATLLYFTVATVAIGSVPLAGLAASDAPLAYLYQEVTGRNPVVITLIGMFAVINGALIQIIMAARVCYGMGRRRWLPLIFARINTVTRTPVLATASVAFLVLVMALWLPLETLAKATSYFLLLVFTLVNLSLWRLKRISVHPHGIISIPLWIPVAGFFASLVFVLVQAAIDILG